jgi:hypothetical protein
LDLIPASLDLARVEMRFMQRPLSTLLLRTALRRGEGFNFELIDSSPSLGHLAALGTLAGEAPGNQRQGSEGSGRCHGGGAGVPRGHVEAN